MRVACSDALGNLQCWIASITGAEDDFVFGIVLLEEAFEVLFEFGFHAVKRFEDGYGWKACGRRPQCLGLCGFCSPTVSHRRHQSHDEKDHGAGGAQERNAKENFQEKGHECGS